MPTPTEIREARARAGLTQQQASVLVHKSPRVWEFYEQDRRNMQGDTWQLFLLLTHQHPDFHVVKRKGPID